MFFTSADYESLSPVFPAQPFVGLPTWRGRWLNPSKVALVASSNSSYSSVDPAIDYYAQNYGITKVFRWDFGPTLAPYRPFSTGPNSGKELWTNFLSHWVTWCQANDVEGVICCPGTPEFIVVPDQDKTTEQFQILSSILGFAGHIAFLGQDNLYCDADIPPYGLLIETAPSTFLNASLRQRNIGTPSPERRYPDAAVLPNAEYRFTDSYLLRFSQPTPGFPFNYKGLLPYGNFTLEPSSDLNVSRLKALVDRSAYGQKSRNEAIRKNTRIFVNVCSRLSGFAISDGNVAGHQRKFLQELGFTVPYSLNVAPHWYGFVDTAWASTYHPPSGAEFFIRENDGAASNRIPTGSAQAPVWAFIGPAIQNTDVSTYDWRPNVPLEVGAWGWDFTSNGSALAYLFLSGNNAKGVGILNAGRIEPLLFNRAYTNTYLYNILCGMSLMEANFFSSYPGSVCSVLGDPLYTPFKEESNQIILRNSTSGEPNERPKHFREFIRRY